MRTPNSLPRLLVVLSASVLLACSGDSNPAAPSGTCLGGVRNGTMTATVNGAAFSAGFSSQATIQNGTANGPNIVQVQGVACPEGGLIPRQIIITLGRLTPITMGTYGLDAAAQGKPPQSGYSGIGSLSIAPNLWYANLSDAAGAGSGSITIASISATRVSGTFQLVAVPAVSNSSSARDRMTITSGSFDLTVP